jgi:hypothetical protein
MMSDDDDEEYWYDDYSDDYDYEEEYNWDDMDYGYDYDDMDYDYMDYDMGMDMPEQAIDPAQVIEAVQNFASNYQTTANGILEDYCQDGVGDCVLDRIPDVADAMDLDLPAQH